MISISSSGALDGSKHLRFKPYSPRSSDDFCKAITERAWSPCIWEDGLRGKRNFITSEYLALDFDDGKWSLMDTLTWITEHGYKAIIATTKSHQKEKVSKSGVASPAVDRFRVVIPFQRSIDDLIEFEYNMGEVMKLTPTDISCKDGGRFYYPCTAIWQVLDGEPYPVHEFTEQMRKEHAGGLENYKLRLSEHKKSNTVPHWCTTLLYKTIPEGERHQTAYKLGATLAQCGWSLDTIFTVYYSSGVCNLKDLGAEELKRALSNGFNKALLNE